MPRHVRAKRPSGALSWPRPRPLLHTSTYRGRSGALPWKQKLRGNPHRLRRAALFISLSLSLTLSLDFSGIESGCLPCTARGAYPG